MKHLHSSTPHGLLFCGEVVNWQRLPGGSIFSTPRSSSLVSDLSLRLVTDLEFVTRVTSLAYTVDTVNTFYTVDTVDIIYTVDIVYTVDMVYTVA